MEAQVLATDIVRKLVNAGYTAYFAGGWVRDYLMGHPSDDIDIATNAPPEKILDLFPRTILVGLAFGVVVVLSDGHQFEVATFRRDVHYVNGRKPTQIELSTPLEDALRRDFTINGMFYDPLNAVVHDYIQGAEDLKTGIIRTIGDPYERFFEDRLRMIRGVRFAARFGFAIDTDTQEAIKANADTLFPSVAMERVWQEFNKMAKYPRFDAAIVNMHRLGLLQTIFPALTEVHLHEIKHHTAAFVGYPADAATILYVMGLFPDATSNEAVELCQYLRTSTAEANLAEFLIRLREKVNQDDERVDFDKVGWTHLYAHPAGRCCLNVIAATMNEDKRIHFLKKHQQRIDLLQKHIQRVIEKKSLVNARLLNEHGIGQGKLMGMLLKEAERLAIENDFNCSDEVLRQLKSTILWPKL